MDLNSEVGRSVRPLVRPLVPQSVDSSVGPSQSFGRYVWLVCSSGSSLGMCSLLVGLYVQLVCSVGIFVLVHRSGCSICRSVGMVSRTPPQN